MIMKSSNYLLDMPGTGRPWVSHTGLCTCLGEMALLCLPWCPLLHHPLHRRLPQCRETSHRKRRRRSYHDFCSRSQWVQTSSSPACNSQTIVTWFAKVGACTDICSAAQSNCESWLATNENLRPRNEILHPVKGVTDEMPESNHVVYKLRSQSSKKFSRQQTW